MTVRVDRADGGCYNLPMAQVTCLGILVADVVGKPIDGLPARGSLAAIDRIELHTGGCAANTGAALAKLGVATNIIGKVGRDGLGDYVLNALARTGADVRGIVQDEHGTPTSATMVIVDSAGERSFITSPGANATFSLEDIDWQIALSAPILHIAGPFLMTRYMGEENAQVLSRAKAAGLITTLDTVWDASGRWMQVLSPCLPHLDYALPSLEEARLITGKEHPREIAEVLLDAGVSVVGVKLGEEGSYVRTQKGDEITVPALKVPTIDSLGAGDAWAAGFLCGLVQGWDLEKTTRFANATGACCVQALGATTGIRSFEETCAIAFGG
ncbi:MAG TPA: sugar kinase [Capsulimonadaceae bacterium]|nr:sugar kinase [Capsulimonadaceae bacterium]